MPSLIKILLTIFVVEMHREELAELSKDELKNLMAYEFKLIMGIENFNPDLFETTPYKYAIAQYIADSKERFQAIEELKSEFEGYTLPGVLKMVYVLQIVLNRQKLLFLKSPIKIEQVNYE